MSYALLITTFLLRLALSNGHWLCSLAGITCPNVAEGEELYLWSEVAIYHHMATVEHSLSLTLCAITCMTRFGCSSLIYFEDTSQCLMGYEEKSRGEEGKFKNLRGLTNVALNKPVYATLTAIPGGGYIHSPEVAVDGKVKENLRHYYSSKKFESTTPWFLVDLTEKKNIKMIRIMSNALFHQETKFKFIQILFGNTFITDGDFSSFDVLTTIEGPFPDMGLWMTVTSNIKETYRYVAIQRTVSNFLPAVLVLHELEIYA